MGWKDTIKTTNWRDSIVEETSKLESGLRGAAQGLSLNLSDEATAALESAAGSLGLVPDKSYEQALQESRAAYSAAEQANPLTYGGGQLAGAIGTSLIPGLNVAKGASLAKNVAMGAGLGATAGFGAGEGLEGSLKSAGIGAAAGGAAGGLSKGLETVSPKLRDYLAQKLGKTAEKTAIMATGATGKQAEEFASGTGKYLTDTDAIGFFDSPKAISNKLSDKMKAAVGQIDEALAANKVQINPDDVAYSMLQKQQELAGYGPTRPMSRELEPFINDYIATMGTNPASVKGLEQLKKDYYSQIKNYNNPMAEGAKKEIARVVKNVVESAMETLPEQNKQFLQAKNAYGILSPVQEAAESRAAQQAQSPFGQLIDVSTYEAAGGGATGVAAGVARKFIAPRASSMVHSASKNMSRALQNPNLSKYAEVINSAINRGPTAAAATDFILQQTDENYRKATRGED